MRRFTLLAGLLIGFFSLKSVAQDAADVLENSLGAVVTVAVFKTQEIKQILGTRGGAPFSEDAYRKALDMSGATSSGSGFLVRKNNKTYIITNAHVIEGASSVSGSLYVYTINQQKYEVKVVGGDNLYDIAVLEFVQPPATAFPALAFRKTEARVGERVYAIGNPLGEYPYTVTDGIISAKNRVRGGNTGKFGFLQTTATVIWGNSGGPLVDAKGQVVGINSQIAFTASPTGRDMLWQSQINFALESRICERLVDELLANQGRVIRGFLGIELVQRYRIFRNNRGEAETVRLDSLPVLSATVARSPAAEKLDAYQGAVLVKVNSEPVRNLDEALGEFEKVRPNQNVTLTFEKNGQLSSITLKAAALETKTLENIARHVISNHLEEIAWNFNSEQPSFSVRKKGMSQYNENGKNFEKVSDYNSDERYYLVAGGLHGEQRKDLWRIQSLSDVGAALRLSGQSGLFDMVVINAQTERAGQLRIDFAHREDVLQKTLWY